MIFSNPSKTRIALLAASTVAMAILASCNRATQGIENGSGLTEVNLNLPNNKDGEKILFDSYAIKVIPSIASEGCTEDGFNGKVSAAGAKPSMKLKSSCSYNLAVDLGLSSEGFDKVEERKKAGMYTNRTSALPNGQAISSESLKNANSNKEALKLSVVVRKIAVTNTLPEGSNDVDVDLDITIDGQGAKTKTPEAPSQEKALAPLKDELGVYRVSQSTQAAELVKFATSNNKPLYVTLTQKNCDPCTKLENNLKSTIETRKNPISTNDKVVLAAADVSANGELISGIPQQLKFQLPADWGTPAFIRCINGQCAFAGSGSKSTEEIKKLLTTGSF